MRVLALSLILTFPAVGACQIYAFKVPTKSISAKVKPQDIKGLLKLYPLIVNGSFFDPPTKTVLGFVVSGGKVLNKGVFKDAVVVKDEKASLVTFKSPSNLNDVDFAISAGPILVRNGKVVVGKEKSEVKLSLRQKARRCGVGILNPQTLIIIVSTQPLTLTEFATLFVRYGATDALNLDGGNSVFLAYKGKVYVWKRNPLNVLLAAEAFKVSKSK